MGLVPKAEKLMRQDKECLQSHSELLRFSKGQILYYQGHSPCGVYWIRSGKILLIRVGNSQEHSEYKETDDILGVEELLKGESFQFTAQAIGDCEVCFIPKIIFQDWREHRYESRAF